MNSIKTGNAPAAENISISQNVHLFRAELNIKNQGAGYHYISDIPAL